MFDGNTRQWGAGRHGEEPAGLTRDVAPGWGPEMPHPTHAIQDSEDRQVHPMSWLRPMMPTKTK